MRRSPNNGVNFSDGSVMNNRYLGNVYSVGEVDTTSSTIKLAKTMEVAYKDTPQWANPPIVKWWVNETVEDELEWIVAKSRFPIRGPSGYGVAPTGQEWAWLAWEEFRRVQYELAPGLYDVGRHNVPAQEEKIQELCRFLQRTSGTVDLAVSGAQAGASSARVFALRAIYDMKELLGERFHEDQVISNFYRHCVGRYPFYWDSETQQMLCNSDPKLWAKLRHQENGDSSEF